RGRERILARCQTRLLGHQPEASLLHGDLWSGNIAFRPDVESSRPVVFDPACYYGDAETDLAMTELFGRFPEAFYKGYQSVRSIDDGYAMRRPVYQLYHVLNHAVLFGNHYMDQAREIIKGLAN
ncbi:MAG: fructosamine-3-kinase, partial [Thalassolituus oleivorans]